MTDGIESRCEGCGEDRLNVEREIGALAQAARNFLLSHSVDDARTLDRLAAKALGCNTVGPPRGVEIEERPCKRCKAEGYVGLDECSDCGCTGTVSVITYEPDEVREYYAAMEAAAHGSASEPGSTCGGTEPKTERA